MEKVVTTNPHIIEVGAVEVKVDSTMEGKMEKIIFTMIITKDHLILSNRHQTISQINFRRTNNLLKVRTIAIIWIILMSRAFGAYENLEFEEWNDIEQ